MTETYKNFMYAWMLFYSMKCMGLIYKMKNFLKQSSVGYHSSAVYLELVHELGK